MKELPDWLFLGTGFVVVVIFAIILSVVVYLLLGAALLYALSYFEVVNFTWTGAGMIAIILFILSLIFHSSK